MIIKRELVLITIILLIGTGVIPAMNSSCAGVVIAQSIENEEQPTSAGFFNPKIKIPEYCYNLSKAPSVYQVGDNLIREEFNFPIGTFGNNYISYGPHGIDRIALYNNFFDSIGGPHGSGADNPRCLDGTFLSVFMDDGENKVSRILQQYPPTDREAKDYGLQPVEKMKCYSNIPIGYYQYQDSEFSAEIGLIVYSPVILYDVKNSSMPVSTWVFNAYNPTDEPIEVSFLFSLENDIGWRNKNNDDSTWQRTGTYNYLQENEDMIGIKYTYDENIMSKSHPEYLGNMTLATIKQSDVTISYVSEWDTLGDGNDLLSTFSTSGMLSNQNDSDRAIEGQHLYAGALSAKVVLEPGEGKNIPFVLATCFPLFNLSNLDGMSSNEFYKWYWTNYFNDSWSIAIYSLNNYENWWKSINDWQDKLYSSGLPHEIMTFMLGSLSAFVTGVFFSEEEYWFTVPAGLGYLENAASINIDWFLCMFYPEIMKYRIKEYCIAVDKHDGFCPTSLWDRKLDLHFESDFVIRAYRAWMWNQDDDEFLKIIYQNCSKAINYTMNRKHFDSRDGLIHNRGNDHGKDFWVMPTSSNLNSRWLLSLKCMINMAEKLQYYEDAKTYKEIFSKAQQSFIDKFWIKTFKHGYFKICADKFGKYGWWYYPDEVQKPIIPYYVRDTHACMIEQIVGVWYGRLIDEDILPLEKTRSALNSIYKINCDYHRKLGWITAVMGNPPYRIDRFGAGLFNNYPNNIDHSSQWSFATSLLAHGFNEEGMTVAKLTTDNYLYNRGGGIYVSHMHNDSRTYGYGTNKVNVIKTWKTIEDRYKRLLIDGGLFGDKDWVVEAGYYPPKITHYLPSWSFYQAASGFTPCAGGLKIKPRLGGNDACYLTQFAGCEIEMNVTGSGDYIESVEINGEPYNIIVDGNVFIPLEEFTDLDEMFIHITLS